MINNEHKDRLFSFMFGSEENKAWILSLYNALNGTHYTEPEDIEITTIGNTVYMSMKNDVSFLFDSIMNFWEQQSTFNPNMPVRLMMYAGRVYDKYIRQHKLNIYGKSIVTLPLPKLVVFYNGTEEKDDETLLELKDSFPEGLDDAEADIAIRVRMLNINKGRNKEITEACKPLSEYSWLIQEIRENGARQMEIEEAVDAALDDMPEDFLIREFLMGNRAEVKNMCITEYNEAETLEMIKEEGRGEGEDKMGRLIKALLTAGRSDDAVKAAEDADARNVLYREFDII